MPERPGYPAVRGEKKTTRECMNAQRWAIVAVWVLALGTGFFAYRLYFGAHTYKVRGRVVGFGDDSLTVIISHEDIPGYMPAMTMPFRARSPEELAHLRVGDAVAFSLVVKQSESWIEHVRPLATSELPATLGASPDIKLSDESVLQEGDVVPGDITLVDQEGRTFTLGSLRGKPVVLTFIYTRCPLPEFCPLMTERFKQLYPELKALFGDNVRLLSVSFDTAYDTPRVLRAYAQKKGIQTDIWTLASGSPEEVGRLASLFQVVYMPEGGDQFVHNLATVVIDPEGRVKRIFRGNRWQPEEVLQVLR